MSCSVKTFLSLLIRTIQTGREKLIHKVKYNFLPRVLLQIVEFLNISVVTCQIAFVHLSCSRFVLVLKNSKYSSTRNENSGQI
jgi:hypothetical protein